MAFGDCHSLGLHMSCNLNDAYTAVHVRLDLGHSSLQWQHFSVIIETHRILERIPHVFMSIR